MPVLIQHHKSVTSILDTPLWSLRFHRGQWEKTAAQRCRKLSAHWKVEDLLVLVLLWHLQFHALPPGSSFYPKETSTIRGHSKEHSYSLSCTYSFSRHAEHLLSTRHCTRRREYSNGRGRQKSLPSSHGPSMKTAGKEGREDNNC